MFTIERAYLEHTGGTKFYQPFLIKYVEDEFTLAATVIHYGPNRSAGSGKDGRPVLGGQTQIKNGSAHFFDQIEAKKKETSKGKYVEDPCDRRISNFHSPTELRKELIRLFGTNVAEDLLLEIGITPDGAEVHPSERAETIDSEPKEKPAEWGSW